MASYATSMIWPSGLALTNIFEAANKVMARYENVESGMVWVMLYFARFAYRKPGKDGAVFFF